MDLLYAVIIIVLTAAVCGVIVLIRHLKGLGDRVVTGFVFTVGAFVAGTLLFVNAASDIRARFPKITFSFAYVVCVFVALLVCVICMKSRLSKIERKRDAEYSFSYQKNGNIADKYTGDDITRFLRDYGYSECRFKDEFVSPAIRSSIFTYRRDHPEA